MSDLISLPEEWWPAFKRGFSLIGLLMPIPMAFAVARDFEVQSAVRDIAVAGGIVAICAVVGG